MNSSSILTFTVLLTSFCGISEAGIIDSFEVGMQSVTANAANGNVSNLIENQDPSQLVNGERRLTIQGQMSVGSIVANVDTANGQLSFVSNNPAYTSPFLGRLMIEHVPGSRADVFDLSPFQNSSYVIDVGSANLGVIGPNFEATVGVSSPSGIQEQVIDFRSSPTPYSIVVPMSDFSGVDLSQAYSLRLDVTGLSSTANFTLDGISFTDTAAVPEPSTWIGSIAVFGLAGMMIRRKRRVA
ncbi:PEP-CTERM sorting domain-containing protein [Fuerstiella marisgermanici]|uniref:Ice-binding protein C-terminal domain-containing protein n=1 Tax=Fuerstiella marisgermanici TaxID=1891926 RepID=A0A1P8WDI0_9PLAN|nr:PEP-CTERM sorting domain-containing protein [Fuerstiella marisgermanici]APZ92126.1 hypothetical protein Fuma_01731 [Fuerstiella marisgermanici]